MTEHRTFKLTEPRMTGEDVRGFQQDLNARLRTLRVDKRVDTDGEYGRATRQTTDEVCTCMGIVAAEAMAHGVTPELRGKIRHGDQRTPEEIARSKSASAQAFRRKLRQQLTGAGVTLTGIDVSNNQASVDFEQVRAAGHVFAFHKASEGLNAADKPFRTRWKAMRSAGLVRGAFHFARPQKGRDPKDEVHEFLRLIDEAGGLQSGDLVPTLDIEAFGKAGPLSPSQTHEWVRGFVTELHRKIGRLPIIYTGVFWREQMGNPHSPGANFDCPLWLAAFVSNPVPFVPKAWHEQSFTIHQHTEEGRCPGVLDRHGAPANCDLDRLVGGEAALNRLRL